VSHDGLTDDTPAGHHRPATMVTLVQ